MNALDIGKKFVLGFHGSQLPKWLEEFAIRFGLGGVILFDYRVETKTYENNILNPKQLKDLIGSIKALPSSPKIFIDQEGGKVRRLKESKGFKPLVSHQEYAQMEKGARLTQLRASFQEMKELGVDVVLGPVVDINYNSSSPDIGFYQRSFSGSLEKVTECALEWFDVAKENELELCLKHYPGLGAAEQNSHEKLTNLSNAFYPEQENLFFDLLPKVPGRHILMSHGVIDSWGEGTPISVNPVAYQRVRDHVLNAQTITDDMQMRGLLDLMSLKMACQAALNCGVDHICIGNNLLNQEKEMVSLVQSLLKSCLVQ
jgi:beta-N-acetylhexosaminidase